MICVSRSPSAEVLTSDGISVQSPRFGTFHESLTVQTELERHVEILCVTVKTPSLRDAVERVPTNIVEGSVIIALLNGFEHMVFLRNHFRGATVIAGTIRIESTQSSQGTIQHTSPFATIELALDPHVQAVVIAFAERLRHIGFDVKLRADESQMLWEKLAFLAPLALMTTEYDAPVGVVRTLHREELVAVVNELCNVALAQGLVLSVPGVIELIDAAPAAMSTSMQRDARAKRPLELDAIGGSILRRGLELGIETPYIAAVVNLLEGT